ncbi:MAG: LLM class flavin-dependent oxidoreductase [Candidatus Thermoplasmatota archaeon]
MKFGLYLPIFGGWLRRSANEKEKELSYDYVKEVAIRAEEIGIDSLWIPDHLLNPPKGEEAPSLEAWTLATAIAEVTEEVDISHTTICEGFRYPAVLAKQASTLQEISEGRFWLSIGAGWFKREYAAFGLDFLEHDERIDKAAETIEIVERLWEENRVDYDGEYYQIEEGIVEPKPDPVPPIWYAGMSDPSRELVAEKADGWLMGADGISKIEEHLKDMKKKLKEKDRDTSEMEYAVPAITILEDTDEEAEERLKALSNGEEKIYDRVYKSGLVGGFETVREDIEKLENLGIDHLLFQLTPTLGELDKIEDLIG